eukprot:754869-Hanusia_phi.AAC.1
MYRRRRLYAPPPGPVGGVSAAATEINCESSWHGVWQRPPPGRSTVSFKFQVCRCQSAAVQQMCGLSSWALIEYGPTLASDPGGPGGDPGPRIIG